MSNTTVMTDELEDDINYDEFIIDEPKKVTNAPAGNKNATDNTRAGQVLDMMNRYQLGTTYFSLIPDKILTAVDDKLIPRLFRRVNWGYLGRIQSHDDARNYVNIQIPSFDDFKSNNVSLTQDQFDCLKRLRDQSKSFSKFTEYANRDRFPEIKKVLQSLSCSKQTVYTYGKLIKIVNKNKGEVKSNEVGHVRVLKFAKGELGKTDFATALSGAIQNKCTALGSSAWMKDYFSRTEGTRTKVVSSRVDQSDGAIKKYSISVTLEEIAPFEITAADLEIANNLNERVFNITKFDDDYYNRLTLAYDKLQELINRMSK